jgi:hypothetical protein
MQNLSISLRIRFFREGPPEVATGFVESFAGEFGGESALEHDEGDAEVVFGLTQSVFNCQQIPSAGFDENAASAILKLPVRPGQVDHEVFVCMTEADHRCCGEHVKDHFLRGSSFEACGAGQHFRADIRSDGDFCFSCQGGTGICGDADGECALAFRVVDRGEYVRRGSTGGQADKSIIFVEAKSREIAAGLDAIVFRAFDGILNGLSAAGDERADKVPRNAEGGWAFRGVEDAESSACASADIEEASTAANAVDDPVDGAGNGREHAGNSRCDAAVFAIHHADDFERGHVIEIARGLVT